MNHSEKNRGITLLEQIFLIKTKQSSIFSIILTIEKIFKRVFPTILRKHLMKTIYKNTLLMLRLFKLINQLYITEYCVTGKEKHTQKKIYLQYFGLRSITPHLEQKIFKERPQYKKIGTVPLWNIKKKIQNHDSNIDGTVIKSDLFYSSYFKKHECIILPEWISMILDVTKPFDELYRHFSNSARRDYKKFLKQEYQIEMITNPETLRYFYYNMYLPYIQKTYGTLAICINYPTMKWLFDSGYKLLFIKHKNLYVSGIMYTIEKRALKPKYMGIIQNKRYLLRQGLGAAMYHASIKKAKESNVDIVDFGGTKPFVQDGAFTYKKKWGCAIEKPDTREFYTIYALKPTENKNTLKKFLRDQPCIHLKKDGTYEPFLTD
jgi:hypothetical protein